MEKQIVEGDNNRRARCTPAWERSQGLSLAAPSGLLVTDKLHGGITNMLITFAKDVKCVALLILWETGLKLKMILTN